jgi:hypothetical protein
MAKKRTPVGQTIGGIVAGIEQQIFRTTPPAQELVAKGAPLRPVAAAGGGTLTVGLPGDSGVPDSAVPDAEATTGQLRLTAPGVAVVVDLVSGGRIASFVVDGHELLLTDGPAPMGWGSFPMAPYAGRIRDGRFEFRGRQHELPLLMPPHAIHGTVLDRPWRVVDHRAITTELGPSWPFGGRAVQQFELAAGLHESPGGSLGRADARLVRLAPVVPTPTSPRRPGSGVCGPTSGARARRRRDAATGSGRDRHG